MGANIWFWLIYVLTLLFGFWGANPWSPGPSMGAVGRVVCPIHSRGYPRAS